VTDWRSLRGICADDFLVRVEDFCRRCCSRELRVPLSSKRTPTPRKEERDQHVRGPAPARSNGLQRKVHGRGTLAELIFHSKRILSFAQHTPAWLSTIHSTAGLGVRSMPTDAPAAATREQPFGVQQGRGRRLPTIDPAATTRCQEIQAENREVSYSLNFMRKLGQCTSTSSIIGEMRGALSYAGERTMII